MRIPPTAFVAHHEVVAAQSPELPYSATLGMTAARRPTPKGLRPEGILSLSVSPIKVENGHHPLQVGAQTTNTPFARAVTQGSGVPWALGHNPFGVV